MPIQGEILLDLPTHIPTRELIHSWDILQQQRSRAKLFKDGHELSVEAIAGVSEQPIVVVDLTERLAWGAASEQIEPTLSSGFEDRLVVLRVGQISLKDLRIWMIQPIRRASIGVVVGSGQDLESSLSETLA
jgi:hypothetical protein